MNVSVNRNLGRNVAGHPMAFRSMQSLKRNSLDIESRRVFAVLTTENIVKPSISPHYEMLVVSERSIDLSRFNKNPVLLDSHDWRSLDSVIGHVEDVQVLNGELVGTLVFSRTPEGESAMRKVEEGSVSGISIGYGWDAAEVERETCDMGDGYEIPYLRVKRWELREVSLVAIPADADATIRNHKGNQTMPYARNEARGKRSAHSVQSANRMLNHNPESHIDDADGTHEDRKERQSSRMPSLGQRLAGIREQGIRSGLAEADIDEALDGVRSADEGRSRLFDLLAERSSQVRTDPYKSPTQRGNSRAMNDAIVDEIAVRLGGTPRESERRQFADMRMAEIGRQFFESEGVQTRSYSDGEVAIMMLTGHQQRNFGGMHTTSDFPSLFVAAGERVLLDRFNALPPVLKKLSRKRLVRDFRPVGLIRPGEAPVLEKLTEAGEIRFGTLGTEEGALSIKPFAKGFVISRQAMVNDDLGGFADFLQAFSEASIAREAIELFAMLSANNFAGQSLKDGNPMFHTSRGNIASSGAALSVESLSAARSAMRTQKNVNGEWLAGATPAVLLVGPALETTAEQLVASITAAKTSDVNPFGGKLRVEVENQYDGNGWWLFADPTSRPAFTHAYLDGEEGPRMRMDEPFGAQGIGVTCELDFGCAPLDWRAAYFNPGL